MNDMITIVQQVAFPIVVSIVLMYFVKHVLDNYVNKMISILEQAIKNNTDAINDLKGVMYARRKGDRNEN